MANRPEYENTLDGLPLRSKEEGFPNEELIDCAQCGRSNPPSRVGCLYCGNALDFDEDQLERLKPVIQKTESWEKAFNIILRGSEGEVEETSLKDASSMLRFDEDLFRDLIDRRTYLPAARAKIEKEAEIVVGKLRDIGFSSTIVSDAELAADGPPKRLRGMRMIDNALEPLLFNESESGVTGRSDVCLIVTGLLFRREIESTRKHSRKNPDKVLATTETSEDATVIDVYGVDDTTGYRIVAKGFDFSCLGEKKGLMASENMVTLKEELRRLFPSAVYDDSYPELRYLLGSIWPLDESDSSLGFKRKNFGGYVRKKLTTSDNERQFTFYSRLRRKLLFDACA